VFSSAERLSPSVINGLTNVYEWHETSKDAAGSVSLISGGSGETPAEDPVISPAGNDVFFVTTESLVPQDTDGEADIYDARTDGGFPQAQAPREPCSSDACQGPLSNPTPLLVPGSSSQTPGENLAGPAPSRLATPKKLTPKCSKARKLSHGKCVKRKARTKAKGKQKAKARKAATNRKG
jgi:hypothetical protein